MVGRKLGVERRVGRGRLDRLLGVFFVFVLCILRGVRWVLGGLLVVLGLRTFQRPLYGVWGALEARK